MKVFAGSVSVELDDGTRWTLSPTDLERLLSVAFKSKEVLEMQLRDLIINRPELVNDCVDNLVNKVVSQGSIDSLEEELILSVSTDEENMLIIENLGLDIWDVLQHPKVRHLDPLERIKSIANALKEPGNVLAKYLVSSCNSDEHLQTVKDWIKLYT